MQGNLSGKSAREIVLAPLLSFCCMFLNEVDALSQILHNSVGTKPANSFSVPPSLFRCRKSFPNTLFVNNIDKWIGMFAVIIFMLFTGKTRVKCGPSRNSVMNTQNGLMTDMVRNGHSVGPCVVRSDPCVVRDAKAVLAQLRDLFPLEDNYI